MQLPEPPLKKYHSPLSPQQRIDTNRTGDISFEEWMEFLGKVQRGRLDFYQKLFLLKDNVYSGLGMEPGDPYATWFQQHGFVRGYWEDFKFYANNNHPLLVMCKSHRLNPFSTAQRKAEFLSAFLVTFGGAGILLGIGNRDPFSKLGFSVLCCTLPTG